MHQGNVALLDAATRKLEYDFFYIKHFSPGLELPIVLMTIRTVLTASAHAPDPTFRKLAYRKLAGDIPLGALAFPTAPHTVQHRTRPRIRAGFPRSRVRGESDFARSAAAMATQADHTQPDRPLSEQETLDFELIYLLEREPHLTQREIAERLGISLGRATIA